MNELYKATLNIAKKKISGGESGELIHRPHLGTGGSFSNIFLWDTAFMAQWAKYHIDEFPIYRSLDNFYRLQDSDGFIGREYFPDGIPFWKKQHPISFAPPLLSWAELELFKYNENMERLQKVYSHLMKFHQWINMNWKREDGLYFCDTLGCGMDNLPRWPKDWKNEHRGIDLTEDCLNFREGYEWVLRDWVGSDSQSWNRQGGWIDTSSQVAFDALCLKKIAEILGKEEDATLYKQEHSEIAAAINEQCWNEEDSFYYDTGFGKQIKRLHIAAFWTMIAEVVPESKIEAFILHLSDPNEFATRVTVPTLAKCEREYDPNGGYWLGGVWAPTNYMILCGLQKYKQHALAKKIAQNYYDATLQIFRDTGTIWENLSPEETKPGKPAGPDFCGWSALGPISIYREFLM